MESACSLRGLTLTVEHRKDSSSTDPQEAPDITNATPDSDVARDSREAPLKELLSRIEAVTWRLYFKRKSKGSPSHTSKPK
jgi:hypothetical protein